MHYTEIFSDDDLQVARGLGLVKGQRHETAPYTILNYTNEATFSRTWNPVTRTCRGLIIDADGNVIARPFRKFHNFGETGAQMGTHTERVSVTDKADGSLGILYPLPNGTHAVATRGSFTSEQAVHATQIWRERYEGRVAVHPNLTLLFEIVYPDNRIVLDYAGLDDLILIGAVNITTGRSLTPQHALSLSGWTGPVIKTFEYATLGAALDAAPRDNAEGLVVHFLDSDHRVKVKYDAYVALHRILTNVTARTLWEFLAVNACWDLAWDGGNDDDEERVKYLERRLHMGKARIREIVAVGPDWMEPYITSVPEEFEAWIRSTVGGIVSAVEAWVDDMCRTYTQVCEAAEIGSDFTGAVDRPTRSRFVQTARKASPNDWRLLMAMLDGEEIHSPLWLRLYPDHEKPYTTISEDTA